MLGSTIYHQHGIIGCGTCVVRARRVEKTKDSGTDDDAWDNPLIVKLSWPAKSRILENDVIQKACNAANTTSAVGSSNTYHKSCMPKIGTSIYYCRR